jgi:hypothetical protein
VTMMCLTYSLSLCLSILPLQLLAAVGEQLCEDPDEICGVACNIRKKQRTHRIEVWTRSRDDDRHRAIVYALANVTGSKRERERQRERECVCLSLCRCVCVYMCACACSCAPASCTCVCTRRVWPPSCVCGGRGRQCQAEVVPAQGGQGQQLGQCDGRIGRQATVLCPPPPLNGTRTHTHTYTHTDPGCVP